MNAAIGNSNPRLWLSALLLPLAGCIAMPQMPRQPVRQDPFAGIDIEKRLPAFPQLNLALFLSENTKNSVAFGRQGGAMGGFDIAPIVESKFELFKANFKSSVRIDRLSDAKTSQADLVALYDSFVEVKGSFRLDVTVVFMDVDGKEIDRVQARGERAFGMLGLGQSPGGPIVQVVGDVNRALERDMRASVKLADFARARGGAGAAVAAFAPAASADVDKPGYALKARPDDFALVVGIERYSKLPEARFAQNDAEAVKKHLEALGLPPRNIIQLSGSDATRSILQGYLDEWLPRNVKPDSTVFFYYSGHGAPDPKTGEAYLVPWDGNASFLQSTAYPLKSLYKSLGALKVKGVLIALDSCFSGAGGRSVLAEGARPLVMKLDESALPRQNLTLLTAASGDEITATLADQGHGIFTYFFLKGLGGAAKDASGKVTAKSLYDYLKPHVQDEAHRQNREQTPLLRGACLDCEIARF